MSSSDDFLFPRICLGLPEPVKTAEGVAPTCDEMRKAIYRGMHDSHLIQQCLDTAHHLGMSGEDIYTLLAYHALLQLEETHRQLTLAINLMPVSPKVTK